MTAPLVAPYVPTYAVRVPYLNVEEYLAAPTGVDPSALIPGGTKAANAAALNTVIRRASTYADSLCNQILAATLDLQSGEYRIRSDWTIRVKLDYSPLVEVVDVKLGSIAGQLTALTDLSGIWPQRKVIRIPVGAYLTASPILTTGATSRNGYLFAQVQYVNGFANTALVGAVSSAATSITVASPYGIFPSLPLTISADDLAQTEDVVVDVSYTQGSTHVPLVAPLTYGHASGQAASALPAEVKQAVTALTTHLIKTRGAEAMSLASVSGGPTHSQVEPAGASEEYDQAVDLLHPFRRVA
jgi:hypothetical protein